MYPVVFRGGIELVHFFYKKCNSDLELEMKGETQRVEDGSQQ